MFGIKAYYQLFLHDKDGKLVWKSRKRRSKSFVIAFLQLIEAQGNFAAVDIQDITDTTKSIGANTQNIRTAGAVGEVNRGIVAGTGTAAEANDDYGLETLIAHGVGAGQLSYGLQAVVGAAVVGANVDLIFTRALLNSSGGLITVTEIGMYCSAGVVPNYFCIIRDVLPAGVDVPDGQTLTVQYTLRTTV